MLVTLVLFFWLPLSASTDSQHIVRVDASVGELLQGYLGWMHKHPEVRPKPGNQAEAAAPFQIKMPSMDVYSPSGELVYYGNSPSGNPQEIHELPKLISQHSLHLDKAARPTLLESFAMFPEIKPYQRTLSGNGRYTLFVLTDAAKPQCRAQDAAIDQLARTMIGTPLQIIEVRLHKKA